MVTSTSFVISWRELKKSETFMRIADTETNYQEEEDWRRKSYQILIIFFAHLGMTGSRMQLNTLTYSFDLARV